MKAKVIKTGEVVNVEKVCDDNNGTFFYQDVNDGDRQWDWGELEIIPDIPKGVTIEGYVARSYSCPRDLGLRVYSVKPKRYEKRKEWNGHGRLSYLIDHRLFPSVTWKSEPKRVKITITLME